MMTIKLNECINLGKLTFKCIGTACPEQYDVFVGEDIVGYVNIRWGRILVTDATLTDTWLQSNLVTNIDDNNRNEILAIAGIAVLSNI